MPSLLEPPTAPSSSRRRRRILSEDSDIRSVQAGLLLTIVFWPLIIWLLGAALRHLGHTPPQSATKTKPAFNIELTQDSFAMPQKQPPPNRFVETNPDAPENIPDKTQNFAAHNQQVAQEKPTVDGKSDTPALSGKKPGEVSQIVDGHLHDPQQPPPPAPSLPMPKVVEPNNQPQARREQNPLAGEQKIQGDNPDGFGTNVSKATENLSDVPERIEGQKQSPVLVGTPQNATPRIDPQHPQPRQRIDRNVRPAVLVENKFGTSNIGPTAIDARWSQYGEYMQKLVETVQVQWEKIIENSRVSPPSGTEVKVKFRIDSSGAISEIIESTSNGGTQAERACRSAITERSPYGKWTDDMIAVLGESQEITFTFFYN